MTTMEERERIEADYEWFRYSKFALPFLIILLLFATAIFCLSVWWGGYTVKQMTEGSPKLFELDDGADQAGVPSANRTVRLIASCIGLVGLLGIFLAMYLKPAGGARKGMYFGCAALLVIGGILAGVGAGLDGDKLNDAVWCRNRERGTVPLGITNCYSMNKLMVATMAVGIAFCFLAIITAVCLGMAAAKSFKAPTAEELEYGVRPRGVSRTTRQALLLLLFFCFAFGVILLVFTIILNEGRDKRFADEAYDVRFYSNPQPGWPKKNTRLRTAASAATILLVLINLIPFRSRVVAYSLGFLYFLLAPLFLVAFAMDCYEISRAQDLKCPGGFKCGYAPFVAAVILEILLAILLIVYVIGEFIGRLCNECQHCTRAFGFFEMQKHETSECSARPIRCEVCTKNMPAKEFVYEHRFDCGHDSSRCEQCSAVVPQFALKKHQSECPKWPVRCNMCDAAFSREDLPSHTSSCTMIPASCEACGETFVASNMDDHLAACGEVIVSCEQCDDELPRYKMGEHLQNDCAMRLVQCSRCGQEIKMFKFDQHAKSCQ
eukprot:NODE_250_length_1926_cov_289.010655_g200_i0.p1 GENE.NODE_250_length_1926_cov_289.010655_g200_i0~~NODE_250_length_1926_cov_289.010655_g200_i0.p1  ORF type:complete len:610 (-),score=111.64 NODE_250_length_1926_cov_289.010655_g200_i0:95-1741(-)